MKIRPVILCGGSGSRLWPNERKYQAKQFIDFGNWTLLEKTLERTKNPIFDSPIISTNQKYLKEVKKHLRKLNIKKYKIVLEPAKMNTLLLLFSYLDELELLRKLARLFERISIMYQNQN